MPNAQFPVYADQSPRLGSLNGVRIREDAVFCNRKGLEKPAIRKRAEKIIEALREVLVKALGPEEMVLDVVRCQSPLGVLEQLTLGWYVYYITRAVLVFTNQRLLCFRVREGGTFGGKLEWKRGVRSASWGDIEEAKVKGWLIPTLNIKYRDGRKETFRGMAGGHARKIKTLLTAIQTSGGAQASATQGMAPLCPGCFTDLTPQVYECGKCRLEFKNESTLLKRLFIPGGDYFYVGLRYLGVVHSIGGVIFLVSAIFYGLAALGLADLLAEPGHPTLRGDAIAGLGIFAFFFALHKLLTFLTCRRLVRQFIPAK